MAGSRRDPFGLCGTVVADKLRVQEVVGEGGFGVVYRAHHEGFDEPVALKCLKLPAHLSSEEQDALVERLRDEGKLLLKLSRRTTGIVQALDIGALTSAAGARIPYLVLEWLEGTTLAEQLRFRRVAMATGPSLKEAVELLRPIAAALAVAHAENVAHRDIKPDNLMLVSERQGGAKILDFGIAKVLEEASSAADAKTSGAIPVFTPGYGAPEQFEKKRGATGPWTDVFALALVFVEVVAGRQAIAGDELIDLYKKATDPVTRPTLKTLGVAAPAAVEQVLARALSVDPRDRYPDAGRFFAALEAAVASSPDLVASVTDPSAADPGSLSSAPTEEFVAGAQAPRAVTVEDPRPAPTAEPAQRTTEPHALTAAPTAAAGKRPSWLVLAVGLTGLAAAVTVIVSRGRGPAPGEGAPPSAETVTSAPALEPPALGLLTLEQYRDPPADQAGKPLTTTAWRAASKSFEVACAQPGAPARWCAGADFSQGQIAFLQSDAERAERHYLAAAEKDPSWSAPHVGLASVWTTRKNLDKALDEAAIAQQLEPGWWGAIAVGARAYSALDKLDGAITEYLRALALAPRSATLLSELALTYHAARMDTQALSTAQQALALSPDLVHIRVMLAERSLEAADGDEALLQADKALAIAPRHVTALLARADALNLLGRKDAQSAYQRLIEVALASGSSKLEPDLQTVADALAQARPAPGRAQRGKAGPAGAPAEGTPSRSKPAPTCRCPPGDPLCSCL